MMSESSNAPCPGAEVLVPRTEAAGVADAMIEAVILMLTINSCFFKKNLLPSPCHDYLPLSLD